MRLCSAQNYAANSPCLYVCIRICRSYRYAVLIVLLVDGSERHTYPFDQPRIRHKSSYTPLKPIAAPIARNGWKFLPFDWYHLLLAVVFHSSDPSPFETVHQEPSLRHVFPADSKQAKVPFSNRIASNCWLLTVHADIDIDSQFLKPHVAVKPCLPNQFGTFMDLMIQNLIDSSR